MIDFQTSNESSINITEMYSFGYTNVVRYVNMLYAIDEAIKIPETCKEF